MKKIEETPIEHLISQYEKDIVSLETGYFENEVDYEKCHAKADKLRDVIYDLNQIK